MPSKFKKELAECNKRLWVSLLACLDNFPFTNTKDWFEVATFHNFLSILGVHFDTTHLSNLFRRMNKNQLQCNRTSNKRYYRIPSERITSPNGGNSGWAIRSMHDRLSKELTRKDNHTKAQIQLDILNKMSMSKAKATLEYESQYYTLEDRIFDKGGLTLVHAQLFQWGRAMLSEIRKKVNHHEISKLKECVLKDAWQSLKSNKDLLKTFVTEIKKIDSDIADAALEELHEGLLLKVFHAQANFELSEFQRKKLETASGNNGSQVNFRTGLKCSSEKKRQRNKKTERGGRKRQKIQSN